MVACIIGKIYRLTSKQTYAAETPDGSSDAKRFCIGPTVDYMFWRGKHAGLELDRGPCMYSILRYIAIQAHLQFVIQGEIRMLTCTL